MKIRYLFLALPVLSLLAFAPGADALPEYCWDVCSCSASCSTVCYDFQVTTCGESELALCSTDPACSPSCGCSGASYGTSSGDTLYGGGGDDCIKGGGGGDTIYGYAGEDDLFGESGADTLYGGSGNDCLDGGSGTDNLRGESGTDTCINGESHVSCESIY